MNNETRFYHFQKSAFLLEIAGNYVRVTPLNGEPQLYSEKPSIIKMWGGLAHDKIRVSRLQANSLRDMFKPINLN